jgi:hypothetical protein
VEGVTVFHAGTAFEREAPSVGGAASAGGPGPVGTAAVVTAGGRVLGVTALAPTIGEARSRAYRGVRAISWPGSHARTDIAREASSSPGGADDLVTASTRPEAR